MTNTLPTAGVAELLARVEAATGPDRELDSLIDRTLCPDGRPPGYDFPGQMLPEYTASLDAALALCERVMPEAWPGFQRNRVTDPAKAWSAWLEVFPDGAEDYDQYEYQSATPALALLAALLKAKANLSGAA